MKHKLFQYLHLSGAVLANIYHGFPSKNLKVIGITGTDGKTTTATLIYHILKSVGFKVGLVSTVAAYMGEQKIETGLHVTSPNPWILQRIIKRLADKNYEYLILEVTSHGLDQFRVWGIDFKIGVLTNITHEHLDYHKSMKNYMLAKSKLFRKSKIAVLNSLYPKFIKLVRKTNKKAEILTYDTKIIPSELSKTIMNIFPENYNLENVAAAYLVCTKLNVSDNDFLKELKGFSGIAGRMEKIENNRGVNIFIDFAHTPNALWNVLSELKERKSPRTRLITVFGCAGDRDREKRPMMGKIAAKLADLTIITAEDPRREPVEEIVSQIVKGIGRYAENIDNLVSDDNYRATVRGSSRLRHKYRVIVDRGEAIYRAMNEFSEKGDTIVICGKGHEESMCYGKRESPWSDQKAVNYALKYKILKVDINNG